MQLIERERASHWYRSEDGVIAPCYELPKKNGVGMKAVTLREARELRLWPSVTNILSVVAKPQLEAWKQEQAILAALTLPRQDGETLEVFAGRVVQDMDDQSKTAREFGTRIHTAVEAALTPGAPVAFDPEIGPYLKGLLSWTENIQSVHAAECYVGNASGYAGKLDLFCILKDMGDAVVDFKTQRVKSNGKGKTPAFYSEWPRQLAAYARCVGNAPLIWPALVSVIIDSGEPGPVYIQRWENPEHHFAMFQNCFALWQDEKGYKPV